MCFPQSRGLHSKHLEEWREEALSEAAKRPRGRPRKDPELAASQKLNKALQRELTRKDKALAELSARIVLQKKN